MGKNKKDHLCSVLWPPEGWPVFRHIHAAHGQSHTKDIKNARVYGLSYKVDSFVPEEYGLALSNLCAYSLSIHAWEYTLINELVEHPVLSFSFPEHGMIEESVDGLKVLARQMPLTPALSRQAVMAAVFLMRQIQAGQVPDYERVLRIYRLHPQLTQKNRVCKKPLVQKTKSFASVPWSFQASSLHSQKEDV